MTKAKIKITDCIFLRDELDQLYEEASDCELNLWAIELSKRAFLFGNIDYLILPDVVEGFYINNERMLGHCTAHEVRISGFRIQKLAKEESDEIARLVLRIAGHAVSTGHMREHAMVASDYMIKLISFFSIDELKIKKEREQQINDLKKIRKITF